MVMMMTMASDWGTWEELLLGGAVLRYGTDDWTVVADELCSHSLPQIFTPEICKAKYKDLRERYLGCKAWFEELKKKRVAELKAALLQSQDSIGSLESKLQSLKSEGNDECHQIDYDSSRTLSLEPSPKSEAGECTSKDTSKDLSSVGSFTQQELITTNWSPEAPAIIEQEEKKKKKINPLHSDIFESVYGGGQVLPSMRKKRGKRKRKDCSGGKDVTEVSVVEESDLLDSSTADIASISRCKEATSTSISQNKGHGLALPKQLMKIYNTISQNECALVFRRRLDSQKRGRYKKLVRRHMDLDTIKSRINGCLISSAKELFVDFLLVANNAAIFYSKNTREHKSALCLRDVVTKSLRHYLTEEDHHYRSRITTSTKVPKLAQKSISPAAKTSLSAKKQRTGTHPLKTNVQDMVKTSSGGKTKCVTDTPTAAVKSSPTAKKGTAVERRRDCRQLDSPAMTGRKRNRVS